MMTDCKICGMIKENKLKKVYEDKNLSVVLCPEPAALGHLWVIPKKHYPIIEQIPDYEIGYLFDVANKVSVSLFEVLESQGTNIFVENGISAGQKYSHVIINIIPRNPNDNINLAWKPRSLSEEEMSTIEIAVKEQMETVGYFEKEKEEPINLDRPKKTISDEEDYLLKSLRRIP